MKTNVRGVPDGPVRGVPAGDSGLSSGPVDATVPPLNTDYDTDSRDRARHRAALAGLRLKKKLKALF